MPHSAALVSEAMSSFTWFRNPPRPVQHCDSSALRSYHLSRYKFISIPSMCECVCVCVLRGFHFGPTEQSHNSNLLARQCIFDCLIYMCVWVFVSVFLCLCVTHAHAYILFLNIFFPNSFFSLRIFDFTTFSTSTIFHWCVANFVQSSPSISISSAVQFLLYTCVVVVCLCVCVLLSYV